MDVLPTVTKTPEKTFDCNCKTFQGNCKTFDCNCKTFDCNCKTFQGNCDRNYWVRLWFQASESINKFYHAVQKMNPYVCTINAFALRTVQWRPSALSLSKDFQLIEDIIKATEATSVISEAAFVLAQQSENRDLTNDEREWYKKLVGLAAKLSTSLYEIERLFGEFYIKKEDEKKHNSLQENPLQKEQKVLKTLIEQVKELSEFTTANKKA